MAEAKTTTDHKKIQQWVAKRGGKPACVRGTGGGGDTGLLRIDFPGYSGEDSLQEIEWDEFFEKFEEQNLAFLYQEKTAAGKPSNFTKFVARDAAGGKSGMRGGKKKAAGGGSRGVAGAARKKSSAKGTKTAKSAARKKSVKGGVSSVGKKAATKKAPKKSGGATKKAAKKTGGRKKAVR